MGIFQRALLVSRHFSFTDESTESVREGELNIIYTKIPSYDMKSQEHVSHGHNAIQAWDLTTTQIYPVLQASS